MIKILSENLFENPRFQNYYGIDWITYIPGGGWNDPMLCVSGIYFSAYRVEDAMFDIWREETGLDTDDDGWEESYTQFMEENREEIEYIVNEVFSYYTDRIIEAGETMLGSEFRVLSTPVDYENIRVRLNNKTEETLDTWGDVADLLYWLARESAYEEYRSEVNALIGDIVRIRRY